MAFEISDSDNSMVTQVCVIHCLFLFCLLLGGPLAFGLTSVLTCPCLRRLVPKRE